MTGKEYQKLAMRTNDGNANYRLRQAQMNNIEFDVGGIFNACLGLSGEVGELKARYPEGFDVVKANNRECNDVQRLNVCSKEGKLYK